MDGRYQVVPVSRVAIPDNFNPRSSLGDISELTESVKEQGLLEPILVRPLDDHFEIFAGFRRLEAVKAAGLTDIPTMIFDECSRQLMLVFNLTENIQRQELNVIDEARGLARLQNEHRMSNDEICAKVGISKGKLAQRFRLLKLTDVVQEALLTDSITVASALEIDRLPKERQGKFVTTAKELRGARLKKMVDKELEKLNKQTETGADPGNKNTDQEKAAVTEMIRNLRKAGQVVCQGLGYDEAQRQRVKDVNFRLLESDDLKVVTKLIDDVAEQVPDDIELNDKAEQAIVEAVEGGAKKLDLERPVVRQMLIASILKHAKDLAVEAAKGTGKRPRVTFALARQALDLVFDSDGAQAPETEPEDATEAQAPETPKARQTPAKKPEDGQKPAKKKGTTAKKTDKS